MTATKFCVAEKKTGSRAILCIQVWMRGEAVGEGAVGHTNRRSAWRFSHLEFPLAFEISFWLIMCLYGCCCVCGVSGGQKVLELRLSLSVSCATVLGTEL